MYWPLFKGLNDWNVVSFTESREMEMLEDAKDAALGDIATCMSEDVAVGGYGAFMTNDKMSWEYYIVQWVSVPYMLQDDLALEEYNLAIIAKAEELVSDEKYLNQVP